MSAIDLKAARIQLRRTRGWRMPPNTVKVDRTTRWGNPFQVGKDGDRATAVRRFRELVERDNDFHAEVCRELAGKNLACWCTPDGPCHADVLLEVANGALQTSPLLA